MLTSADIEAALRSALPPELHPHLAGIAQILQSAAIGAITPDSADMRLAKEPAFNPVLRELAKSQDATNTVVSLGQDTQTGDVGMRDVVGGNLLSFTINNYHREQGSTVLPVTQQAPSAMALALAQPIPEPDDDEPIAPFVAGPPIMHPQAFFGREAIVRRIFGLLKRTPLQNAVIIGPRRSGKTSLLHYLRAITRTPASQLRPDQRSDWLDRPDRYRWVMVDFQDARLSSKEGLLKYILTQLGLAIPHPCTLDRFLDVVASNLNHPTVMLFDEIGKALQSYADLDDELWESLRSLGPQIGGKLAFILATHTHPVQIASNTGHSSPFFNIFGYTTKLGPFTEIEGRELIASSNLLFSLDDIDWIIAHSNCWPILIQLFCRERLAALENNNMNDDWRSDSLLLLRQMPNLTSLLSPKQPQ